MFTWLAQELWTAWRRRRVLKPALVECCYQKQQNPAQQPPSGQGFEGEKHATEVIYSGSNREF